MNIEQWLDERIPDEVFLDESWMPKYLPDTGDFPNGQYSWEDMIENIGPELPPNELSADEQP